jgi:hypothetical protein
MKVDVKGLRLVVDLGHIENGDTHVDGSGLSLGVGTNAYLMGLSSGWC